MIYNGFFSGSVQMIPGVEAPSPPVHSRTQRTSSSPSTDCLRGQKVQQGGTSVFMSPFLPSQAARPGRPPALISEMKDAIDPLHATQPPNQDKLKNFVGKYMIS